MTSIELFAGCGGLLLGLERAGFECVLANDFVKDACDTINKNLGREVAVCEPVEKFCERELPEVDLVSGGCPCQAFSYAGKRLAFEDTRGTLFYYYAQVLKRVKPKAFIFENVVGMYTHDGGRTFETIKSVLAECGYTIFDKILSANDYGVPQMRKRLIVVGIRNDCVHGDFQFPEPQEYKPVLRDIELEVNPPRSECATYSERLKHLYSKIKPGENWRNHKDDPEVWEYVNPNARKTGGGQTGVLLRLSPDLPCRTILTSPVMKLTQRCHPYEDRPLSVRETARIQSFPDSWEFCGGKGSRYKQIGNAVPPKLGEAVGRQVKKYLEELR